MSAGIYDHSPATSRPTKNRTFAVGASMKYLGSTFEAKPFEFLGHQFLTAIEDLLEFKSSYCQREERLPHQEPHLPVRVKVHRRTECHSRPQGWELVILCGMFHAVCCLVGGDADT